MTQIAFGPSLAARQLQTLRVSKNVSLLALGVGDSVLFWKGSPVSIETGKMVYWHQEKREAGCTRAINAHAPDLPHVNTSSHSFDFIAGGLLTKAGMGLVRREV